MNILSINPGIADLDSKGILFEGKYYSCGPAIKNHWFENLEETEVTVYYTPDNLDFIYLQQYYARLNELREQKAELIITKKGKRKWL